MYPEKDSGAGEGLKSESSEEWLRVFRLEKRRLGRDLKILCNSLKVCFSQVGGGSWPLVPDNNQLDKRKWSQIMPEEV